MNPPAGTPAQHGMPEYSFPEDIYGAILKGKQRFGTLMSSFETVTGCFNSSSAGKTLEDVVVEQFNFLNRNLINFYGHKTENDRAGARMHLHLLIVMFAQNHALLSKVTSDEKLFCTIDLRQVGEKTREAGHAHIAQETELQGNLPIIEERLGASYGFDFLKYVDAIDETPVPLAVQESLIRMLLPPVEDIRGNVIIHGESETACQEALKPAAFLCNQSSLKQIMTVSAPIQPGFIHELSV